MDDAESRRGVTFCWRRRAIGPDRDREWPEASQQREGGDSRGRQRPVGELFRMTGKKPGAGQCGDHQDGSRPKDTFARQDGAAREMDASRWCIDFSLAEQFADER